MTKTLERKEVSSYEQALGGRKTKQLQAAFPAVWTPINAGEFITGKYLGSETITPKGEKMTVHKLVLESWNATFSRSKAEYTPNMDEVISFSGRVLDTALQGTAVDTLIGIKFVGLGEKKGKRNAAKLFEVDVISE